jgi:hypothetical protein
MTNYSESDVNAVNQITKELFFKYTNEPYYLKETLRQIRSLVHQTNLQADKLITADWFKYFDPKNTIAEGTLGRLIVSVKYKVSFTDSVFRPEKEVSPYWELDIYLNDNDYIVSLYKGDKRFNSLQEAITVTKQTLLPLCNLFSKLEI